MKSVPELRNNSESTALAKKFIRDREKEETASDFIFGGSKINVDGDCSHEIRRCFLLGRKLMTNLDSILKSRDITLPIKVHLVKAQTTGFSS